MDASSRLGSQAFGEARPAHFQSLCTISLPPPRVSPCSSSILDRNNIETGSPVFKQTCQVLRHRTMRGMLGAVLVLGNVDGTMCVLQAGLLFGNQFLTMPGPGRIRQAFTGKTGYAKPPATLPASQQLHQMIQSWRPEKFITSTSPAEPPIAPSPANNQPSFPSTSSSLRSKTII